MTPNPAIVASYDRALLKRGMQVIVKRVTGFAPNPTASISAWVVAMVTDYQPDTTQPAQTGYAATKMGAITEGDRLVILMATDLEAKRFPLPLQKNDKIIIVDTGDELNVIDVDGYKRAVAGAVELKAASVA
jgi:hypothetical protein